MVIFVGQLCCLIIGVSSGALGMKDLRVKAREQVTIPQIATNALLVEHPVRSREKNAANRRARFAGGEHTNYGDKSCFPTNRALGSGLAAPK